MPYVNGFEILSKIKELKINTSVIIMSNLAQPEDVKKAKTLGASYYFIKSETPITTMVKKVKSLIR